MNETGQREYDYSSVFINSVQPSDSGSYTLTATNYLPGGVTLVGSDAGSFSLNVLCELNLKYTLCVLGMIGQDPESYVYVNSSGVCHNPHLLSNIYL